MGRSEVTVEWFIPNNQATGTYRIQHYGHYKTILGGKIKPYSGTSNTFEVSIQQSQGNAVVLTGIVKNLPNVPCQWRSQLSYTITEYLVQKIFHPAGTSNGSDICEGFTSLWLKLYNGHLWESAVLFFRLMYWLFMYATKYIST